MATLPKRRSSPSETLPAKPPSSYGRPDTKIFNASKKPVKEIEASICSFELNLGTLGTALGHFCILTGAEPLLSAAAPSTELVNVADGTAHFAVAKERGAAK